MTTLYYSPSENGNNPTEYTTEDVLEAVEGWVKWMAREQIETAHPTPNMAVERVQWFREESLTAKDKLRLMLNDIFSQHGVDVR